MYQILGAILCLLAAVLVLKKAELILLGTSARGEIVGYGTGTKGTKGMAAYPYLVRFEWEGRTVTARALESALGSTGGAFRDKNLHREVTVFFRKKDPSVVTVKEFKGLYAVGLGFFLLGLTAFFL